MHYCRPFSELTLKDIDCAGGKNASLGELIGQLALGIDTICFIVPDVNILR